MTTCAWQRFERHHSAIVGTGYKSLTEGAKVTYEARQGEKGPEATDVTAAG